MNESPDQQNLASLYPEEGRVFLTGSGKDFIERIGIEAVRNIVLSVMMGENVRFQTEPLTRFRLTQVTAAMVMMFLNGCAEIENFSGELSGMALDILAGDRKGIGKDAILSAQWLIGLTAKQVQNVLRDDKAELQNYVTAFDQVMEQSAERCVKDYGDIKVNMSSIKDGNGRVAELGWKDLLRLTTAIGCQTLAIRGSDKSMYGKLFEKLILGSTLTALGFQRVIREGLQKTDKVFWLSDSSNNREIDATLIYRLGKMAVFDMGFIGRGNSEISKDKVSRFERVVEIDGQKFDTITFIIIDRLPKKSEKILEATKRIGGEIIQMHWAFWPRRLAQRLNERLGFDHPIIGMSDTEMRTFFTEKMATMPIEEFLYATVIDELKEEQESDDVHTFESVIENLINTHDDDEE